MGKAIAIGAVVFLLLILVRVPAGIIHWLIPQGSQANVLGPQGTVWTGSGELIVQGISTGTLTWEVHPVTFLKGRIGYDLTLTGAGTDLNARLAAGLVSTEGTFNGTVDSAFVNRWLSPYHIELGGEFDLMAVNVNLQGRSLTALDGRLSWDGGPVRYRLSGNVHNSALPPMTADLGPGPVAVAYAAGESTPLLHMALNEEENQKGGKEGFVKIGVTKYLTNVLGQPWPGGDPDHAVVLEVEEQVF
jgi:hypothetical protein